MDKGIDKLIKMMRAQEGLFGSVELTPDDAAELIAALEQTQQKASVYDMLREDYSLSGSLADFVDRQATRITYLEKTLRGTEETLIAASDKIAELESAPNGMMQLSNELAEMKRSGKWVARSAHMPDPNDKRRVCVYTPNIADDIRYRLVPASLFKAVCSDATHWHYIEPPVEGGE